MPDMFIDARGKKRCWSCGAKWTVIHPVTCWAKCDDSDQYPTVPQTNKPYTNVYGYVVRQVHAKGTPHDDMYCGRVSGVYVPSR